MLAVIFVLVDKRNKKKSKTFSAWILWS